MELDWSPIFSPLPQSKGLFISFEGIEGAGKSTQIKLLTEHLQNNNKEVLCVREPGGTRFGEKLRQAILHSTKSLHPYSEALLFASSRGQLLQEKILPFLDRPSKVVICDRYIDSSLVYQGMARELGGKCILDLHAHPPLNTLPHITFFIEISVECSFERQAARNNAKDYFESEKIQFYQKLSTGYKEISASAPQRVKVIDGEKKRNGNTSRYLSAT